MANYRQIYKKFYGPIPKDKDGRTYEIHHIDGNYKNDSPKNLMAVTIQEHYDIHYKQEDWAACSAMAIRMKLSCKEISILATKNNLKRSTNKKHPFQTRQDGTNLQTDRVANGTHHLLRRPDGTSQASDKVRDGTHHLLRRPDGTSQASDKVRDGTHHLLGGEIQRNAAQQRVIDGTHNLQGENNPSHKRIKKGTHNFLGDKNPSYQRVKEGIHNFQTKKVCPFCLREITGLGNFNRWHSDKCKFK